MSCAFAILALKVTLEIIMGSSGPNNKKGMSLALGYGSD